MKNWTYTEDGSQAYAETSDPRVLAVIQRDDDSHGPDGDAIEPAYYLEGNAYGWGNGGRCGSTFDDDEVMDAFTTALDRFEYTRRDDMVRRYMRIFHGTEYRVIDSSISRGAQVVVFNTPAFRSHIGLGDTYTEVVTADFQAYIDGEVFAIGYAVQEGRVLEDAELNFEDFEVTIECWGYYGEDWAMSAALDFEYGSPNLPTMLDIPA